MPMPISLPLLAALVVGACAPLVGVFVVSRRQAFLADALAHVSLVGIAAASLLSVAPLPVTLIVVAAVALLLEELSLRRAHVAQEALLALALSGALALANILLASHGEEAGHMEELLFGSLATVVPADVFVLTLLCTGVVACLFFFRRQFFLLALDRDMAAAGGLAIGVYSRVFAVLVACMVVLIARTVGVLLCGALLVSPALTARLLAKDFRQALWIAFLVGEVAVCTGYALGVWTHLPLESLMVLVAIGLFALSLAKPR